MPVCDKCGEKIMVGARMCIHCGAEVKNPICPVPPVRRSQNRTLVILLCCAVAVAILLTAVLLVVVMRETSAPSMQNYTTPPRVTLSPTKPQPTDPPAPTYPVVRIPCTNVEADVMLMLVKELSTMQLSYSLEPVDTTDDVKFTSNNPAVATVDSNGRVTAVSTGEATIFITCGSITKECVVTCYWDDEPDVPDEPMPDLKLRMTDISFNAKGYQWRAFERTEGFDETKFTWTMDDETVATVDNGFVTTVAPGRTTLRVYYKGEQVASCIIRCVWTEEGEAVKNPRTIHWLDVDAESTYDSTGNLTGFLLQGMFTVDSDNHEGFVVETSSAFERGHKPFFVDAYDPGYMYFSFWLPVDASYAGWHTVTVHFDGISESVEFCLDYLGGYADLIGTPESAYGRGWTVSEWKTT